MALSSPQQQAGIISFYDAPEKGPRISAKVLFIAVALFTLLIILFDHFAASA